MITKSIYRLGGFALILGGVLVGVGLAFHHSEVTSETIVTTRWSAVHIAAGFGFLLSLFGLFAVYNRQNERSGFWGLLSLILVVLSTAVWGAATLLLEGLLAPALAARGIALDEFMVPGQPLFLGFLITMLVFAVGYVLLGVVAFRVNALCRVASVLFIISAPAIVLGLTALPMIVFRIGGVVFGVALIRFGSILWSTADMTTERFVSRRLATA